MFRKMLWVLAIASVFVASPVMAAAGDRGHLVSASWLAQNFKSEDLLILDASYSKLHAAGHIPGAVSVDLFTYGVQEIPTAELERRFQSWGISAGKKVVIYDEGGSFMATKLFFDLYYQGFPATQLFVLDGGLSKWKEAGGAVTTESTAAPKPGSFRITRTNESVRVRLPEFLAASGDPTNQVLVEALEPTYHFGEGKFFDRAGHVPNGILMPTADFFNPDKTFKSDEELRRMLAYLGVKPEQKVHAYCGGGLAASVPFFALKFVLNYPNVTLYKESQLEWLRDDRGLPIWTYDAPYLTRDMHWLNGWGSRMLRMYGVAQLSVVDVRPAESYKQGHVPFAVNIPADVFRSHFDDPAKLTETLSAAGVDPAYEAVIVSEGGLNPASASAFLMLERLGQKKVSVLMQSVDDWGLGGLPLAKEATVVGPKKSPQDLSVPLTNYPAKLRAGIVIRDVNSTKGHYPKVLIASGRKPPTKALDGKLIHVPYSDLLNANGTPKAAKDIWNILVKAGVPRYAEIICFADDPGEAAVNYVILKLMGYPDVKVLVI